jgi:hypothetical protein
MKKTPPSKALRDAVKRCKRLMEQSAKLGNWKTVTRGQRG